MKPAATNKNIVICLDGTGNQFGKNNSNRRRSQLPLDTSKCHRSYHGRQDEL